MDPEGSLPHSQVPATCPYPEPARSSPYPHIPLPEDQIFILSSHLRLVLPSGLFPKGFPTKTLYTPLLSPLRATRPAHLILEFIILTILGEHYRSPETTDFFLLYITIVRHVSYLTVVKLHDYFDSLS